VPVNKQCLGEVYGVFSVRNVASSVDDHDMFAPTFRGAVAVWPGRHVAPVVANNGDGTITVAVSWAKHRVRVAGLVFVDPGR
jgi:hypothetical protein